MFGRSRWFQRRCPRCGKGRRDRLLEAEGAGMMTYSCGHHSFFVLAQPAAAQRTGDLLTE